MRMRVAILSLLVAAHLRAQPLSDRAAANLTAFARLYSIVRFFHPSDEVEKADWNAIAVAGVTQLENADELAPALQRFFLPVAPTLDTAASIPAPRVAWRHYGGHFDASPSKTMTSARVDERTPSIGTMAQGVDAASLRGKQLRVTFAARADADGAVELRAFPGESARVSLSRAAWNQYEVALDVPMNADRVVFAVFVRGAGTVWLDEISAPFINGGFDAGEAGPQPASWTFPYESLKAGYRLAVAPREECRRGLCARISSTPLTTPRFADTPFIADLGNGISMRVPIALPVSRDAATAAPSWIGVDSRADSRASRLAATIVAWSIVTQLHPFADKPLDLKGALQRVAVAKDRDEVRNAILEMLEPSGDARVAVEDLLPHAPKRLLPLAWAWIDGKLIVTSSAVDGLRPGDAITLIDGKPVVRSPRLGVGTENAIVTLTVDGREVRSAYTRTTPLEDTKLARLDEVRPGVLYADLRRLGDADLPAILTRARNAQAIVFDLRGETDMGTTLLSHLIRKTARSSTWELPVLMRPDRQDVDWLETFWTIEPIAPRLTMPVAFLVDERAAGYVETLLDMIDDERLGTLVGTPSAGSNGSVNRATLPASLRFHWTTLRIRRRDGTLDRGVQPAIRVAPTRAGLAAGRDEVLERALAALSIE